ncbi:hypothetical protein ANTPLA_LOCUS10037 [Anthophora plagiata]
MAAPAQLKSLIKTRAIIKGNVTRLIGYFSDNADVDIDDIQTRKVKLEECYQAFSNTQLEIEILVEETQVDSDQELERARFDEQYFKCAKIINQRLRVLSASQATSEPGTPTSHSENMQMPKFAELIEFLSKQERGDESEICSSTIGNQIQIKLEKHANKVGKSSSHRGQSFVGTQTRNECNFCNSNHSIYACEKFLKLNPRERSNAARSKRLCINCLRNNHPTNKCYAPGCKTCHRKHNTLLHFIESHAQTRIEESSKRDSNSSSSTDQVKQGYTVTYDSEVLLGTARVKILDRYNKEHECRVLLDGCSQGHFISENLAQKLQLNKERIDLPFAGLGQLTTRAEYRVRTIIKSKNNNFQSEAEFIALPKITSMLPSRRVNRKELLIPQNIKWLVQNENKWKIKQLADMVIPEQRVKAALLVTERNVAVPGSSVELNTRDAAENEQNTKSDTFERISSIDRLIRFVAFCRRAVSNRKVEFKTSGKYTIEELKRARLQIIRVIQQKHFSRDIKNLKEGIPLNSKAVHPGADNIVRVATVKTQTGVYKRCVKKLAPLPIDRPTDN